MCLWEVGGSYQPEGKTGGGTKQSVEERRGDRPRVSGRIRGSKRSRQWPYWTSGKGVGRKVIYLFTALGAKRGGGALSGKRRGKLELVVMP